MKKSGLWEAEWLAQGHTTNEKKCQERSLGPPVFKLALRIRFPQLYPLMCHLLVDDPKQEEKAGEQLRLQ